MKALIASGSDRYADPWHPFPRTSRALAELLSNAGYDVTVDDDVDRAMTRLADVDLLVVNAGDPWRGSAPDAVPAATATEGLAAALRRGVGILGMHTAVASLRDYPDWATAIGGMWIPGTSAHPPAGDATISGAADSPVPVESFTLFDERYCRLQQLGRRDVVAWHEGTDRPEPTAWVRKVGASRVAVDVLGHDERSYDSKGHRQMILALAHWCTSS